MVACNLIKQQKRLSVFQDLMFSPISFKALPLISPCITYLYVVSTPFMHLTRVLNHIAECCCIYKTHNLAGDLK